MIFSVATITLTPGKQHAVYFLKKGDKIHMQITDFFKLLGGLALFLFGMQLMGSGLEAGGGKPDENYFGEVDGKQSQRRSGGRRNYGGYPVLLGDYCHGGRFISAGLMTLNQAVWVIMGANIGTTITGQLIALDIGMLAPLIAFAGVIMTVFVKNEKAQHIGGIIAGLGILFIGMDMMSAAMEPFRNQIPLYVSFQILTILSSVFWQELYLPPLSSLHRRRWGFYRRWL